MLPVNHSLESRYFERMARGMTAKSELVLLARPGSVLNVGAGGPELSSEFEAVGHPTISVDAAPEACERLAAAGLRFIKGNAEELQDIVDEPVDNVVFSSVLHEVFSYAESDGRDAIRDVLKAAFNILKPGGRILIRDGVRPLGNNGKLITEVDEMRDLAEGYITLSPFMNSEIRLTRESENSWTGDLHSVLEVLNTINWGASSLPRESQEIFGVFTAQQYLIELSRAGFSRPQHFMEDGTYRKHLEGRAHVEDALGRHLWISPTAKWIAQKPIDS